MRLVALCFGFTGSIFAFVDASHFASGFGSNYFRLGLGNHSWFWWHCGQIGFGFIIAAFIIELIHYFTGRDTTKSFAGPSGFQRLGILISGLWLVFASAIYYAGLALYPSHLTMALSRLYIWTAGAPAAQGQPGHDLGFIPEYPSSDLSALFALCLLPLVAGWFFLWLLPLSVRWIKAGFALNYRKT